MCYCEHVDQFQEVEGREESEGISVCRQSVHFKSQKSKNVIKSVQISWHVFIGWLPAYQGVLCKKKTKITDHVSYQFKGFLGQSTYTSSRVYLLTVDHNS